MKLTLLTLALASAASLYAQPPGGGAPRDLPDGPPGGPENPRGPRPPRPLFVGPLMAALDTNKDGELSPEEIAAASTSLKTLDKDGDGKVSRDELRPSAPPLPPNPKDPGGPGGPGENHPPRPGKDQGKGAFHESSGRPGEPGDLSRDEGRREGRGPRPGRAFAAGVIAGRAFEEGRQFAEGRLFAEGRGHRGPDFAGESPQPPFRSPRSEETDSGDGRPGFHFPPPPAGSRPGGRFEGRPEGRGDNGPGFFRGPRPDRDQAPGMHHGENGRGHRPEAEAPLPPPPPGPRVGQGDSGDENEGPGAPPPIAAAPPAPVPAPEFQPAPEDLPVPAESAPSPAASSPAAQ